MNDKQLQEIKDRESKATKGPWVHLENTPFWGEIRTANEKEFTQIAVMPHLDDRTDDFNFIAWAREDIPALVVEVERLQAERQNHTLIHNDALNGLVAENERLYKGNVFSCGCRFSASPIGWGWDFCDLHASVHLQKREIERLQKEAEALRGTGA
jgi:hypothetical protein